MHMSVNPMESLLMDGKEEEFAEINIEIMETSITQNTFRKDLPNKMYNAWLQT